MAPISNASRLAEFGSGIGTDGAVIQVDNINKRVGIGTTNPQGMLQVGQGVTVYGSTGIVSATSYYGDGSNLDGLVSAAVTQYIAADSITSSGIVTITNTTDATSTSTGALIISGGVGIAKSLHVGQNITIGGTLTYEDVTNVDSIGVVTARSGVNVSGGQFLVGSGVTIGNAGVATFSGTSDIHLTDGVRLKFGDGNDLQIHHSSTNSFIQDAGTGNLYIDTNQLYLRNYDTSNTLLYTSSEGQVLINYNGSTKFETTNDGTVTTGIATASGFSLTSGGAERVNIAHVSGGDVLIKNPTAAYLAFGTNNTERLRITSAGLVGIDTTAPRCALDLGDNDHTDAATLSNTPADYQLGVHAAQSTTGDIGRNIGFIALNANKVTAAINSVDDGTNDTSGLLFATGNGSGLSERLKVTGGGDVEFYGTAAGVASCTWDASANSLILKDNSKAVFGDGSDLSIYHAGNASYIEDSGTGALVIAASQLAMWDSAKSETMFVATESGSVDLYYDNSKKIETTNDGVVISGICTDSKGDVRSIPSNDQTGSYTMVASDAGKVIYTNSGVTVPANVFKQGHAISIVNYSSSAITITQGSSLTLRTGSDTGNKDLDAYSMATVWFGAATLAFMSGSFS